MAEVCANRAAALLGLVLVAALSAAGCGDGLNLVNVSGTVTLDGRPLDKATVIFRPKQGRPSSGITDAEGRYTLRYTAEKLGALTGEHAVSITSVAGGSEDDAAPARETIPARYNRKTVLTATVDSSNRTHDFALESKK